MEGQQKSEVNKQYVRTSEGNEDDGFFSDVPSRGSLSKSQAAMNRYVKKNLLYDDNSDDYELEDDAYFSKESSPNESVSKCDTESFISTDSFERKDSFTHNPVNEIKTNQNTKIEVTENEVNETYANQPESEIVNVEQTDDYKSMQLLETPKHSQFDNHLQTNSSDEALGKVSDVNDIEKLQNNNVIFKHSENQLQTSKSLINLAAQSEHEQSSEDTNHDHPPQVIRRQSTKNQNNDEHRHTVNDFSEWVNRTNIYPDVYAPLPYKSPRRYVESDVNIHYRVPVRHDPLPLVPERELARQQAEHMKRLYREQRRNKYLQELQDMQNRRHQDNFTPSQKNILPLNRYDEADKVMARALYAFNGQTNRELSFRKGDLINVRKQIDANWYEGELHGRIGLFPYNYVEILKGDVSQSPRKPSTVEGRARAKFDFTAQTNLELPLKKGELVVLTRRIDHNWWEGRNGNKTGIFPDNYVTILQEPSQSKPEPLSIQSADKPVASPAAHGLLNGSAKRSMGAHSYLPQPNSQALSNAPPATQPLPGYVARPAQATLTPSSRGYGPPTAPGVDLNNTEPLYVDTNAEAVPYRAMYKYRPQNPDELELNEGDTVYVLEQCDDGWYVGSSQRTGRFGTFPGNYVERI